MSDLTYRRIRVILALVLVLGLVASAVTFALLRHECVVTAIERVAPFIGLYAGIGIGVIVLAPRFVDPPFRDTDA